MLLMPDIGKHIEDIFPGFDEPELRDAIITCAKWLELPAGSVFMEYGGYVKFMPLVVKGAIKVMRTDDNGDELFLYYLYPGQSCAMTIHCCSNNTPSVVRAVAEEDTAVIAVPVDKVREWMDRYRGWRDFLMKTYSDRFLELLQTVDSIAFLDMDKRLEKYLLEKIQVSGSREINITHQEIASDMHTSREVVSRLLKQMEKKGKIILGRNRIEVM